MASGVPAASGASAAEDAGASADEVAFVGRPPSLVVGVGAARGAPVGEVLGLVEDALRDAGLCVASVAELATVDTKSGEPGIVGAAEHLGVPLVTYPAGELADVEVPNPSGAPLSAAGTASVAEAAALAGGGELLVPKRKSAAVPARATCAVVRRPARAEVRRASVPVGLDRHVDLVRDDSCGYRIPLPGCEDEVGLPQQPHRHGQGHVHSHEH
ncbi:cobalamin biosynthesis protein [Streptomyces olivaceus]|nr:cobalamin biosynthesis protein [Streptomyces olivaceus]